MYFATSNRWMFEWWWWAERCVNSSRTEWANGFDSLSGPPKWWWQCASSADTWDDSGHSITFSSLPQLTSWLYWSILGKVKPDKMPQTGGGWRELNTWVEKVNKCRCLLIKTVHSATGGPIPRGTFKWISLQISKRILVSNLVMIYMLLQKVIQHDKNEIPQHQGISGLLWISDQTCSEKKYVLAVFQEQYDEFDKHSSGSVSKWPIYTFHSH